VCRGSRLGSKDGLEGTVGGASSIDEPCKSLSSIGGSKLFRSWLSEANAFRSGVGLHHRIPPFKSGISSAERSRVPERNRGRCDADVLAFVNRVRRARSLGSLSRLRFEGADRSDIYGCVLALSMLCAVDLSTMRFETEEEAAAVARATGTERAGRFGVYLPDFVVDFGVSFDNGLLSRPRGARLRGPACDRTLRFRRSR
jgi:hypothetical protein